MACKTTKSILEHTNLQISYILKSVVMGLVQVASGIEKLSTPFRVILNYVANSFPELCVSVDAHIRVTTRQHLLDGLDKVRDLFPH